MRIRMIHRQLFPLFQHIVKNLPVRMETLVGLSSSYAGGEGMCQSRPRMVRVGLQQRSSMSDMVAAGIRRAPSHRAQNSSTEL